MSLKFVKITSKNKAELQQRIASLEAVSCYPLGDDTFRLNHGEDYFAFFERLGDLLYYAVIDTDRDQVVAVACGMFRTISYEGKKDLRTWYLADLKVHPNYRGQHIPLKMLTRAALPFRYFKCRHAYTISMNNPDQNENENENENENRMARLLARCKWASLKKAENLNIYSLNFEQVNHYINKLEKELGNISFLSLAGKKDLILSSTGKTMPLLHMQYGPCAEAGENKPKAGHTHMFCLPKSNPFIKELQQIDLKPNATATIIHHRMNKNDWNFILTSDI